MLAARELMGSFVVTFSWCDVVQCRSANCCIMKHAISRPAPTAAIIPDSVLSPHLTRTSNSTCMVEGIEAFSPGVEKRFLSAKFLVDLLVLHAKRR